MARLRFPKRLRPWIRRAAAVAPMAVGGALLLGAIVLLATRFVPIRATPLMGVRLVQGEGWNQRWVSIDKLPAHVPRAVLAAEDQRFCEHGGVDLVQMQEAVGDWWTEGKKLRGASTLSMQTTKNVFLWPGRSWLRKLVELPLTPAVELFWGKRRVIEVYLNVAEWGPGVYGIEAAARHHYGIPAAELTAWQASVLAAVLPSPRTRPVAEPSEYTTRRAWAIQADIAAVDDSCFQAGR